MAKISTVKSISESQRAQFKQRVKSKKTALSNKPARSSQPGKINRGKTSSPAIQNRSLINAAFQQKIQTAIKSPPQRKTSIDTARNIKNVRFKSIINPLSSNRTINRTSKANSLISRNRFSVKNAGKTQIRPRIKSLGKSEVKNQIKIPDAPQSSLKIGRINLLV